MPNSSERRHDPRLPLCYAIQVTAARSEAARPAERTITQNLSARGAYFCTFREPPWKAGAHVAVLVSVPHRLAVDGGEIMLGLRGRARVVRLETPAVNLAGEDGVPLSGVALEFDGPLRL